MPQNAPEHDLLSQGFRNRDILRLACTVTAETASTLHNGISQRIEKITKAPTASRTWSRNTLTLSNITINTVGQKYPPC